MSEKHLTEAAWKALATKKKVKDSDLGKALAAYGKAGDEDYDARLEALGDIEKSAQALRKEYKADSDLSGYLGDVAGEAAKTRKAVEAEQKEAEQEEAESEDEGGADPVALKKRMISLMAKVKSSGPEDKPLGFMACIAGNETAVVLAKTIGASQKKALKEMLPEASGLKYVEGECRFEDNQHTFVLDSVPSGLAKRLRVALLRETGINYKVQARSSDGSQKDAADADADPQATEAPTAPPPAPPAGNGQAEFLTNLKALKPDLDKVVAAKPPIVGEVTALLGQVAALGKAQNFLEGNEKLTQLAALVKTGLQQMGATAPTAPGPNGEAEFKARLASLLPKIKEAIAANSPAATDLRSRAAEAGGFAKQGNYSQANTVLSQIEILLGGKPSGQTVPPPPPPPQPAPGAAPAAAITQLTQAFEKIVPKIKEVLTTNPALKDQLTALIALFRNQLKAQDATAAKDSLTKLVALLRGTSATEPAPTGETPSEEKETPEGEGEQSVNPDEQAWNTQFGPVEARYRALMSTKPENGVRLQAVMIAASDFAGEGNFAQALVNLKRLTELMDGDSGATEKIGYEGIVEYRKSLVELSKAISQVNGQIDALKKKIPETDPNQADLADALAASLRVLTTDLYDAVNEAMKTAENEDTPITRAVVKELASFTAEISGNPLVQHVDENPYMKLNIEQTLGDALAAVNDAIPVAA